jgi:KUP system potassium uptake protein
MAVSVTSTEAHDGPVTTGFWALTLGSIGVVFGDIGTSPLHAFREAATAAAQGQPITRVIVLGVLSLILWALFVVVTAKYVLLLLRADSNGEGGTLSLMALGQRALGRRSWPLLALGVIGASMFIGDSMITPAISVLSAVEGLKLATPALEHYVVPLTVFILVRANRGRHRLRSGSRFPSCAHRQPRRRSGFPVRPSITSFEPPYPEMTAH